MKSVTWIITVSLAVKMALSTVELSKDIELSEKSHALSHTRKRRYVVFPEGSTLTVATSLQIAACVSPTALSGTGAIFTGGLAWALSYDLPNETIHIKDKKYDFPVMIRRHKRNLFVRVEKLMDSAGLDGRNCVLKTICETAQRVLPRQGILEEILRLLFTAVFNVLIVSWIFIYCKPVIKKKPEQELYPPDESAKFNWLVGKNYVGAHEAGESDENCNDLFPCPISLLELGLKFGKYSPDYL